MPPRAPGQLANVVYFSSGGVAPQGGSGSAGSIQIVNAVANAVPNNGAAAGAAINAVLANVIGAGKATLYFPPGVYSIDTNITFPANVRVWMAKGARFNAIVPGQTLAINGDFEAPLDQVFDYSAQAFTLVLGRPVQDLYPQWWGAVGDGVSVDSPALIATAQVALGKRINLGDGNYSLAAEIPLPAKCEVIGWGGAMLACNGTRFRSYLSLNGIAGVTVRGVTFDLGQPVLPLYTLADYNAAVNIGSGYNIGILAQLASDLKVENCTFQNLYTHGILCYQQSGKNSFRGNTFTSPVQGQNLNLQQIHLQTCGGNFDIDDCSFDNAAPANAHTGVAGVFFSGTTGPIRVINSYFNYCGRDTNGGHQLGAISSYGDTRYLTIKNNTLLNCLAQVIRLSVCWHVEVANNHMEMSNVANVGDQMISCEGTENFAPGLVGVKNHRIHHNTFIDNFDVTRIGVFVGAYDYAIPSEDIYIERNRFENLSRSVWFAGPFKNFNVLFNTVRGANGGIVYFQEGSVALGTTATHGVTEAQSVHLDLRIVGNNFDLTVSGANTIYLDWTKAPAYTGTIGKVEILKNIGRMSALSAGAFIVTRANPVTVGRLTLEGNEADSYATAFDVADFAEFFYLNNKVRSCTNNDAGNLGTNGAVHRRGNHFSVGASSGRAVLVAGTVQVNTVEVLAGDNILLTRVVAGGGQGVLTIGAIVNKTSFVITSASGTDTSTIFWEIVH